MEKDGNNVSAAAAASLVGVMQFVAESQTEWTTDILTRSQCAVWVQRRKDE